MSDWGWPESGPGMPSRDAETSRRVKRAGEPGSVKGPGSRAVRRRTSFYDLTYDHWRDRMDSLEKGARASSTVPRPVFAKGLNQLFAADLGMTPEEYRETPSAHRGTNERRRHQHEVARKAFDLFASDVRSGKVKANGKNLWFVFVGRRSKYWDMAEASLAYEEMKETGAAPKEIMRTGEWI